MTLIFLIEHLAWFKPLLAIYAADPWREDSAATLIPMPDEGPIPPEAIPQGYTYVLDVFFAQEMLVALQASLACEPTLRQKFEYLTRYAREENLKRDESLAKE